MSWGHSSRRLTAYRAAGGYALATSCIDDRYEKAREGDIMAVMGESGLRGLGGVRAFPARGASRRAVGGGAAHRPDGDLKYRAEGEAGVCKRDRWYLERDPHRFMEARLKSRRGRWASTGCASTCATNTTAAAASSWEARLAALRSGPPACFHLASPAPGAGAYICGEESAMIGVQRPRADSWRAAPP